MSDRLGLMHAIHELPADDLPRLAYADWLEEQGELEHAEFIRVELALSHTSREDEDKWRPLFRREVELIRAYKDEWFGTCRHDWTYYEMRRGFIEEVSASHGSAVVPHADWLFNYHSLYDLWVGGHLDASRSLLHHPLASIVARLSLVGASPGPYNHTSITRGLPLAQRPLLLSLNGHRAGPELVSDLLDSPYLGRLSALDLSGNVISASGVQTLLDGLEVFPRLKKLRVCGNLVEETPRRLTQWPNVNQDGVLALANHPATEQLEQIDLSNNNLDGDVVSALIDSPYLGRVTELTISPRPIRVDCERLIACFGDRVKLPSG